MALPAHTLHSPAGLGIDEATRPELIEFGTKNLSCLNVRQDKRGDVSKRFGFDALGNTSIDGVTAATGLRILSDRDTLVRIGEPTGASPLLTVYDAQSTQWAAISGRPSECSLRLIDLPSMGNTSHIDDVAYANGYFCVVWRAFAPGSPAQAYTFAALINAASGAIVSSTIQVGVSAFETAPPLLVAVGNYFIVVRADAGGNPIKASYLNSASGSTIATGWVAMADLAADQHAANISIAACSLPHASQARAALVYINNSAGVSNVTVKTFTQAGVLETQTIATNSVVPTVVDCSGSALDTLWVTWNEATLAKVRGLAPLAITTAALASTATVMTASATPTLFAIQASSTAGTGRLFINDGAAAMQSAMRGFVTTAGATVASGSQTTVFSAHACGRPFFRTGRYYIPVYVGDTSNLQQQVTVVDWTDNVGTLRPVANPTPGLGSINSSGKCTVVAGADANKFYFGLGIVRSSVANASCLLEMDFASSRRWQPASWGNSTYLTGGVLQYLDGARIAEVGFIMRPSTPTVALGGTGITGTYRYVAVYESIDADGNWSVSGLSTPSASTSPANQTVTVTTLPLTVTSRNSSVSSQAGSVRIAWYRTLNGGIAPYYRLGTTVNDPAAVVTFADAVTDATLAVNSKLYSQPGVNGTAQDRRTAPGLNVLVSYNGMLVGATGSDVWYSGQNVSGEGAWFNPIFQVPIPGEGLITGLWVMDGTLFVAKRREIYAISGEPPSDNGSVGGLGLPRRLAVDVGCIESRSTCVTALGTFFQSDRGIEILSRAQAVEWIGESMQDTLASFPVVTSATVDPVSCTVLIELAVSESAGLVTGNGRTLVFDLTLKDWVSTDQRKSVAGVAATPSQSACIIYTGTAWRYAWIGANGRVYTESTGYLDADSSFVTAQYETAWLKHGLQQEQRVWSGTILFEQASAAGLTIEVAYDYATYSGADDKTWAEALTLSKRQLEWRPKPRGQAMKFRVKDTAPAIVGTGQGFTFVGMSFDLAQKQGPTKGVVRLAVAGRK
jgi:hypothetical protein